jgi:hypothetical protein
LSNDRWTLLGQRTVELAEKALLTSDSSENKS